MRMLRQNQGLTLIELIVAIAIGTIVTAAATAVMLVGLRIYASSNSKALRQNEVRLAITVMENLMTEAVDVNVKNNAVYSGEVVEGEEKTPLLSCVDGVIYTEAGAKLLDGVESFQPAMVGDLLTIRIGTDGETYTFSVYCRVAAEPQAEAAVFARREQSPEEILTMAIHDEALAPGVRAFLKVLASQVGSDGRILTEDGTGEYYSSWYIGGYENNPGWSEETPWCICFISWAMEECRGYIPGQTMKYANVDKFWAEFIVTDALTTTDPQPGDVVFFDWNVDSDRDPEHAGVVYAVQNGWIYTIEGNSNSSVEICRYMVDSAYILGFGRLNFN